jgi:uncharacterized RDD family membrane protein YckC
MTIQEVPPGMGRCEVTGKIVPADELVVLGGQTVCAEGKAILLERMKAGEAMPGEAERPTVLRRFGCMLLDGLILWVPAAIVGVVTGALGAGGAAASMTSAMIVIGLGQLLIVAIYVGYFGIMHGTRAQTVGKMAGSLKVVRLDGKPMDMQTGFIRAIAYQGPSVIPAIAIMIGNPIIQMAASIAVSVYALANLLVALFDRHQQRAIHDRIAGTRVILVNK